MARSALVVLALVLSSASAGAHPPLAGAPGAPVQQPATAAAPRAQGGGGARPVNVTVSVTDGVGLPVSDVHVTVHGPVTRDGVTVGDGSFRALALKPGAYRLRFEHERFITLERDLTVRAGQPASVDVMMSRAPEKPKVEAPPAPPPVAAPSRTTAPLPATAFDVTAYLEREYLKSGANRVKSIACSASDSVKLVQTTTSYASAAGKRQLVVVAIAGQGRVTVGGKSSPIDSRSGTTVAVPEDTGFEATREGRSTLVFVVVEIGSGCQE